MSDKEHFYSLVHCNPCGHRWLEEHEKEEIWAPDNCGKCGGYAVTVGVDGSLTGNRDNIWVEVSGTAVVWNEH